MIDFGLSKIYDDSNIDMINADYRGTGLYVAPETILYKHRGIVNSIYSDTFVVGFLLL